MKISTDHTYKTVKAITIAMLLLLALWGAAMVFFPIRPFWIDEWRLLYNLKLKSPEALWGKLDLTQQFPRVYLSILKTFTSGFNYNYFSLRVHSCVLAISSMLLVWQLMKRLFPEKTVLRFLFVMILVSSRTFTDYIVQIKQYEMEIFLSLVALWQLLELVDIRERGVLRPGRYLLLCLSFLVVPFFSYTYPIAVAPVYAVVLFQSLRSPAQEHRGKSLLFQWLPLVLGAASILVFYIIDVSQLMKDEEMHQYWQYRMRGEGFNILQILGRFWGLLSEVGAGAVFEVLFGLLGVSAFFYGISQSLKEIRSRKMNKEHLVRLYSVLLLVLVVVLFLASKIPMGEAKFNAFTVPAIAILIIYLLSQLNTVASLKKVIAGLNATLFIALFGNVISTIVNSFTAPEYKKRMTIYRNTEEAIRLAQKHGYAIMVTPGVAYPDDITQFPPFLAPVSADIVLKTFPSFNTKSYTPVYAIDSIEEASALLSTVPPEMNGVMVGDGITYQLVR
jgi:hypothetical protein